MGRVASTGGVLILGSAALLAVPAPASAFLEFLFGGRPAQVDTAPQAAPSPLDVHVSPKRRRSRPGSESHKAAKHREAAPAVVRQIAMNPRKDPDWYLKDPNIRFGDILILDSGPVVYQGSGKARSREDFVALRRSRLSETGARDIRMMAAGIWLPLESEAPAPRSIRRKTAR